MTRQPPEPEPALPSRTSPPAEPARPRRAVRALVVTSSLLLTVGLFEAASRVVIATGLIDAPPPTSDSSFWDPDHEQFGVWHVPGSSSSHVSDCFEVGYRANSVGARDAERARASDAPRVVVLGDSNVEGWGLPLEQRLSSLLERATGIEHLNFAMAHFSPYQSYLVYRELASDFSHDLVLVGINPNTDFYDLDYEAARRSPAYEYRYRPYPAGDYPDFEHVDYREATWMRPLRRRFYTFNVVSYFTRALRGGDASRTEWIAEHGALVPSHFYSFDEHHYLLLQYSLERLLEAANGRPVAAFLIPLQRDLLRYHQSGKSPLAQRLETFGAERDLAVIDLTGPFHDRTQAWYEYYFTCDHAHMNDLGNRVAAETILRELPTFYERARREESP